MDERAASTLENVSDTDVDRMFSFRQRGGYGTHLQCYGWLQRIRFGLTARLVDSGKY